MAYRFVASMAVVALALAASAKASVLLRFMLENSVAASKRVHRLGGSMGNQLFTTAKRWTTVLLVAGMGMAGSAQAYFDPVTGLTWLNPALVTNTSWNQIDTVCYHEGKAGARTACTGPATTGGFDLSGWVWAFQSEVDTLFHNVVVKNGGPNYSGNSYHDAGGWGLQSVLDLGPTHVQPGDEYSLALSATPAAGNSVVLPDMEFSYPPLFGLQSSAVNEMTDANAAGPTFGGWFYQGAKRKPVVIIPGIEGSELKRADDQTLVWLDVVKAAASPSDAFLFQLLLKEDGQTPDAGTYCSQSLHSCRNDSDCPYFFTGFDRCVSGGTNIIPGNVLNIETGIPLTSYTPYQTLATYLAANGYTRDVDLFIFPYDWRRDVGSQAVLFNSWVQSHLPSNTSFDIVAHSMGGILTRAYLEQQGSSRVNSVIYLGTPHSGATAGYSLLKGQTNLLRDGFYSSFPNNLNTTVFISQHFPAAYELMPRFDFASRTGVNGSFEPFATTYANTFAPPAPLVTKANSFWSSLGGNPVSRSFQINGTQHRTLVALDLSHAECPKGLSDPTGDSTVPTVSSTSFVNRSAISYVVEEHAKLPGNVSVEAKVFNILQGHESDTVDGILDSSVPAADGWRWYSCSPIRVQIQDQDGNTNGLDTEGKLLEEIEDSTQLRFPNSEGGFLPLQNTYSVAIQAIDNGMFTLGFDHLVPPDDAVSNSIIFAGIPISVRSRASLTLNPNDSAPILSLDVDGDGSPDFFIPANVPTPAVVFVAVLTDIVNGFVLTADIGKSLQQKLAAARAALDRGDNAAAKGQLSAFLNEVNAQRGKKLTLSQADTLTQLTRASLARI